MAQVGPWMAQVGPRMAQVGPWMAQVPVQGPQAMDCNRLYIKHLLIFIGAICSDKNQQCAKCQLLTHQAHNNPDGLRQGFDGTPLSARRHYLSWDSPRRASTTLMM